MIVKKTASSGTCSVRMWFWAGSVIQFGTNDSRVSLHLRDVRPKHTQCHALLQALCQYRSLHVGTYKTATGRTVDIYHLCQETVCDFALCSYVCQAWHQAPGTLRQWGLCSGLARSLPHDAEFAFGDRGMKHVGGSKRSVSNEGLECRRGLAWCRGHSSGHVGLDQPQASFAGTHSPNVAPSSRSGAIGAQASKHQARRYKTDAHPLICTCRRTQK